MTIENSRAAVDLASCSVDGAGDTLTVHWSVRFRESFVGPHSLLLMAEDAAGSTMGWSVVSSWIVGQRRLEALPSDGGILDHLLEETQSRSRLRMEATEESIWAIDAQ